MLVFTNANFVSKALRQGVAKGLVTILCSVDAGTAETYRRIKGRPMLDRVWKSLAEYAALDRDRVTAKYIVMESNRSAEEIDEFFRRAQEAGVRSFIASANAFQNAQNDGDLPTLTKYAMAYLVKRGREIGEAKAADLFTQAMEAEIEALSQKDITELRLALAAARNHPGSLELSFSDSETFVAKAKSISDARDDFTILLSGAVSEYPATLRRAVDTAIAQGAVVRNVSAPKGPGHIAVEVAF
jgi:coenzyme F420-reducing hydrogenase delta subunit